MQEEVNQEVIAISVQTVQLSAELLSSMLDEALEKMNDMKKDYHGKMSLKELMAQNAGAVTIEINEDNIKAFEKTARKFNMDFAVQKDKTVDPPKFLVFFKARDKDVMAQAFKEYIHENEKNKEKPPFDKVLNEFKEKAAKMMEQVKDKEKNKKREREL